MPSCTSTAGQASTTTSTQDSTNISKTTIREQDTLSDINMIASPQQEPIIFQGLTQTDQEPSNSLTDLQFAKSKQISSSTNEQKSDTVSEVNEKILFHNFSSSFSCDPCGYFAESHQDQFQEKQDYSKKHQRDLRQTPPSVQRQIKALKTEPEYEEGNDIDKESDDDIIFPSPRQATEPALPEIIPAELKAIQLTVPRHHWSNRS